MNKDDLPENYLPSKPVWDMTTEELREDTHRLHLRHRARRKKAGLYNPPLHGIYDGEPKMCYRCGLMMHSHLNNCLDLDDQGPERGTYG